MIGPEAAHGAARAALRERLAGGDPLFTGWRGLDAGAPVRVETPGGAFAYWLAPLEAEGRPVGFARVTLAGDVAAIGMTCPRPDQPDGCPVPVHAMPLDEVASRAEAAWPEARAAAFAPPRLVHDGPPGREVWLVEARREGGAACWIFVGPGGAYLRRAGSTHSCE